MKCWLEAQLKILKNSQRAILMLNDQDQQLIKDYFKGDDESLEFLIKRYLKPIHGFIYRIVGDLAEAEELTQEVFVRVWRHLKKFDQDRSFKTWLYAIAKNAAFDFLRKKKAVPFSAFEDEAGDNPLLDQLADEIVARQDLSALLSSAMKKLSPKSRALLSLYYLEHFTLQEIADSLDESINTIKSRHRRALIALRKILTKLTGINDVGH